jgi:hypothetical protein
MKKFLIIVLLMSTICSVSYSQTESCVARIIIVEVGTTLPTSSVVDDGVICYIKANDQYYINKKGAGWSPMNPTGGTGLVDTANVVLSKQNADANYTKLIDLRLDNSRPASDVYTWAKASTKPTYTYSEVGAAATSHTQTISTVTGSQDSLNNKLNRGEATTLLATKQVTLVSGTNIKTVNSNSLLGSGDIVISGSAAWGSVTGTLSNQTDLNSALNGKQATLTRNTGLIVYTALANGTTAMAFGTNSTVKVTPTATATYTTTVPAAGCEAFLIILTSGTTSYTITFGTGFKTTGTLATGTVTAKVFVLEFISDGTTLNQVSRTTAM